MHAISIQATLDKAVGKDESLVAKFFGHDLVTVFVNSSRPFSAIPVYPKAAWNHQHVY